MSSTSAMATVAKVIKRTLASPKAQEQLLRMALLILIWLWAFSIRLVRRVEGWGGGWGGVLDARGDQEGREGVATPSSPRLEQQHRWSRAAGWDAALPPTHSQRQSQTATNAARARGQTHTTQTHTRNQAHTDDG